MGGVAAPHLGGSALGADVHIGEPAGAVGVDHVAGHDVRQGGGGGGFNEGARLAGPLGQGGQAQGIFHLEDEPGHGGLAAVGDGSHVGHNGAGVGQVVVLAHAGPGQLAGGAGKVKPPGGGGEAADLIGGGEASLLGVLGHDLRPQFGGQLAEHPVAGVGQGVIDVHFPVDMGAGDGLAPHIGGTGAGPSPVKEVGDILNGGGQGHRLEHRARREGAGEEAV